MSESDVVRAEMVPEPKGLSNWKIVAIVGAGLFALAVIGNILESLEDADQAVVAKKQTAVKIEADEDLQRKRLSLIQQLQRQGIVHKIDTPGSVPRCYVGPAFYHLTIDDKKAFMEVCYAWSNKLPQDVSPGLDVVMWIHDSRTDKRIGMFSSFGLQLAD